jgi:hypothetical protein
VDKLEGDFVTARHGEMGGREAEAYFAYGFASLSMQIAVPRCHPEGQGLIDQILGKSPLMMQRHHVASISRSLINDPLGEITLQFVHRT